MNVVEVEFDNGRKTGYYVNEKFRLKKNITVIVDSEKGLQFGKVVNFCNNEDFRDVTLYKVIRIATKRDYLKHIENLDLIKEAIKKGRQLVKESGLSMSIFDGMYNFDRSQLMFRFVADERVDFRQLARNLGSLFRTRIELRQIGIRDKAKEIGGIGPCGRLLCCSSFLNSFDSITISMAKNQNVSLNPNKINGVCGRLLCCLKYENDTYLAVKDKLSGVGNHFVYHKREGKVIATDVLKENFKVEFPDKSIMEVESNDM